VWHHDKQKGQTPRIEFQQYFRKSRHHPLERQRSRDAVCLCEFCLSRLPLPSGRKKVALSSRPAQGVAAQKATFPNVCHKQCSRQFHAPVEFVNETGQSEVYITHFPEVTRRYQVSTQGGTGPHWRGDGREPFYFSGPQNSMIAVNIDEKIEDLSLGSPRALFHVANNAGIVGFDVTRMAGVF